MRTKGYGLCMTFGKTGCIIVPIYVSYLQIFSQNPLVYIGFLCVLAIICIFYIPETYDQQMQDRLDEAGNNEKELDNINSNRMLAEEDDIFMN